jgi:arylsulfatase A-like enzyme
LGGAGNKPIPRELRGGFSDFIGYQCYNGFVKDVCFYDEENRENCFDRHRTEVTTDLAVERLDRASRHEKPFALFISYQSPHYPVQPAPKFERMYSGRPMMKRPNYREVDPYTPTISPPSPRPFIEDPDFRKYGNDMNEYMKLYYAMCTQVDSNVGRLIERLKQLGIFEDTIIFYTSDHGDLQGAHGLKNKNLPWEESSGIPLIIRVPGQKGGRVCREAVDSTSFYPTILDWAGLKEIGERSDGISLVPYLEGQAAEPSFPAFSERKSSGGGSWRMVCLDGFKFVARYGKDGILIPEALFNLAEDPYEMNNLLDDSGFGTVRERLFAMVEDWHSGVPVRTIRYREAKNE